jgi:hypothetical protein
VEEKRSRAQQGAEHPQADGEERRVRISSEKTNFHCLWLCALKVFQTNDNSVGTAGIYRDFRSRLMRRKGALAAAAVRVR